MKYLKGKTKLTGIVVSSVMILALITLIMLSTLLNITNTTRIIMCLIYSVALLFILLIAKGVVDLQVFNDYEKQNKWLCADGIVSICMGALLAIVEILFGCFQAYSIAKGIILTTIDIRWFIAAFLFIMAAWRLSGAIIAIINKHFDFWLDSIKVIIWILLGVFTVLTITCSSSLLAFTWTIIALIWALIILITFGILFSFVIKDPKYLETDEAYQIRKEELDAKALEKEKNKQLAKGINLEHNLEELKKLSDSSLITNEDYQKMKDELLREMFINKEENK